MATITTLNAKINEVKNKIPTITILATTTALNTKINEVKNKIFTTTGYIAVENKKLNVSNLVKKTDYNTKISKAKNKTTTDLDHHHQVNIRKFYCNISTRKVSKQKWYC